MFISTLNGIVVSVWYVFSTSVVLHAELNVQLQRRRIIVKAIRNEEN